MTTLKSVIFIFAFLPSGGAVLQIIRGNKDNLGIILHIFHKYKSCDTSLEWSCQDGTNEGSQHKCLSRNKNIFDYPCYPLLSGVFWVNSKEKLHKSCLPS